MREARLCAAALDDALADRSERRPGDGAGAQATMARLEEGSLSPRAARRLAEARAGEGAPDLWRAVLARTWVERRDGPLRRGAFVDGSPDVRRAAVRAAALAERPPADCAITQGEVEALMEVARVDPEPRVRTEAVRALARAPLLPDERSAHRLGDLWTSADGPLREDIARVWLTPELAPRGGRRALEVRLADARGEDGLGVALAVLAVAQTPGREDLRDLVPTARAVVIGAMASAPRRSRLRALGALSAKDPDVLVELRKVREDSDPDLRVVALARLLDVQGEREGALRALEAQAAVKGRGGARARGVLSATGHVAVQAWVEEDLTSPDPSLRLEALQDLVALRRGARGAGLLADDDPSVRLRAACALLR